jgi:leucyl-tRNA synthetase
MVKTYGADTLRVYEMFMGPFDQMVAWNTDSVMGARRFIEKIWRLADKVGVQVSVENLAVKKLLHKTIKKVESDIENINYNTAISSMMILAGAMEKVDSIGIENYKKFLQIIAPFAPHVAEELWQLLINSDKKLINTDKNQSIHLSDWPKYDESLIIDDTFTIAVQINGKVRTEIEISAEEDENQIKEKVLENKIVKNWLKKSEIKKFIYIKKRLVNIVV